MTEELGLAGAVSIALGGMIGGGIYAVLGVVTQIAGAATWAGFVAAGTVALCTGYSFDRLNRLSDDRGGLVTFVQCFAGNTTLAGVVGWTLLVGYVGSMAMYAFAFGEFALALAGIPREGAGVWLRPLVSIAAVVAFVGLNLLGARATGTAETVLVAGKVVVLVGFGVGGLAYVSLASPGAVSFGVEGLTTAGPVTAAGVAFVAFQGWQLLFYDQESIADPEETIRRAVLVSIPVAVAIYVLVAVATVNLAPEALATRPHTALSDAAATVGGAVGLAALGAFLISASALLSTGSAINATLFSTGYFAKSLISADLVPDRIGDAQAGGVPTRTVLVLGAVTAGLTAAGSLEVITSFASVAFVVVFGGANALAFRHRGEASIRPLPPLVGALGAVGFLPIMLRHLYRSSLGTFYAVCLLAVVVVGLELLYFERDVLEREVEAYVPVDLGG